MISACCSFNIIVIRWALTLDPPDGQNPVLDIGGSQQNGAGSVFQGGGSQITGGGSASWGGEAEIRRDLSNLTPAYCGHIMRKQGSCRDKEIMQRTMPGVRRRRRPRTAWMDNIKTYTGLSMAWKSQSEWQRTDINGENVSIVWPTFGSRTAKE